VLTAERLGCLPSLRRTKLIASCRLDQLEWGISDLRLKNWSRRHSVELWLRTHIVRSLLRRHSTCCVPNPVPIAMPEPVSKMACIAIAGSNQRRRWTWRRTPHFVISP
jgi:hypothetical protein